MFLLKTNAGREVSLDWGTYAMHIYCEKQGIDLKGFLEQVGTLQFSIGIMIGILSAASIAATGQEPTQKEACEWIDECGGLLATQGPLIDFVNYLVSRTVVKTTEDVGAGEKKSH